MPNWKWTLTIAKSALLNKKNNKHGLNIQEEILDVFF